MSDDSYVRWAPAGSPIAVEYSADAIDRVRALAADGFTRLARGGVEIGGVLFGTYANGRVRIMDVRAVDCTYARAPFFILTAQNRTRFVEMLESAETDPQLTGLTPVGWFVSHSRPELRLTETDREIFAEHFPHPWQVTLVMRPGRAGSTRAGFFVRSAKGTLTSDMSPLEFNLDPLPETGLTAAPIVSAGRTQTAFEPSEFASSSSLFQGPLNTSGTRKWVLISGWAVAVLAIAVAATLYFKPQRSQPISLAVMDKKGEMRAEWNRNSPLISNAKRGVLDIQDGATSRSVNLSADQLAAGSYPFLRRETDVRLKLHVYTDSGTEVVEAARYLGGPSAVAEDARKSAMEAGKLESDNESLREALKAERQKAQALQKKVDSLEDLLRIERNRSEVFRSKAK